MAEKDTSRQKKDKHRHRGKQTERWTYHIMVLGLIAVRSSGNLLLRLLAGGQCPGNAQYFLQKLTVLQKAHQQAINQTTPGSDCKNAQPLISQPRNQTTSNISQEKHQSNHLHPQSNHHIMLMSPIHPSKSSTKPPNYPKVILERHPPIYPPE